MAERQEPDALHRTRLANTSAASGTADAVPDVGDAVATDDRAWGHRALSATAATGIDPIRASASGIRRVEAWRVARSDGGHALLPEGISSSTVQLGAPGANRTKGTKAVVRVRAGRSDVPPRRLSAILSGRRRHRRNPNAGHAVWIDASHGGRDGPDPSILRTVPPTRPHGRQQHGPAPPPRLEAQGLGVEPRLFE